uniref:Tyr recombinase domain-containing protein n=1 Tax=Strongyloides venezuelensis TaxID=75913 RepID=A0A0K0FQ34_STRVS
MKDRYVNSTYRTTKCVEKHWRKFYKKYHIKRIKPYMLIQFATELHEKLTLKSVITLKGALLMMTSRNNIKIPRRTLEDLTDLIKSFQRAETFTKKSRQTWDTRKLQQYLNKNPLREEAKIHQIVARLITLILLAQPLGLHEIHMINRNNIIVKQDRITTTFPKTTKIKAAGYSFDIVDEDNIITTKDTLKRYIEATQMVTTTNSPLIITSKGTRASKQTIKRLFLTELEKSQIMKERHTPFSLHDVRSAVISTKLAQTKSVAASEILRLEQWKNIETVGRYYVKPLTVTNR